MFVVVVVVVVVYTITQLTENNSVPTAVFSDRVCCSTVLVKTGELSFTSVTVTNRMVLLDEPALSVT